jgi:hypothetical protein
MLRPRPPRRIAGRTGYCSRLLLVVLVVLAKITEREPRLALAA